MEDQGTIKTHLNKRKQIINTKNYSTEQKDILEESSTSRNKFSNQQDIIIDTT